MRLQSSHFRSHPGVNPLSMLRAVWGVCTGTRRGGGSTITMQLARLRFGLETRSFKGKLTQMFRAVQFERHFTKDEILTNVMLYWVTQSIGTSFLCYRDFTKPPEEPASAGRDADLSRGAPTGFAIFPEEIANAPREWAERFYDVRHWSEMPAGGHFGAWEEPEHLVKDLRAFFRPLR